MQNMNMRYAADDLKTQINATKPILILVFAGLLLLLVGLHALPEESTPLMAKVMSLLCPTLAAAGVGAYLGRNLRGWLPIIGLLILSVILSFTISVAGVFAIPLLLGWGVINGMFIGPLIAFAIEDAGAPVVIQALTGTTAVMLLTALIVFATGINFSFLAPIMFLGLMGLIIVGLVSIFIRFSRTVNLTYSILGMIIFALYFLYDFFRVSQSENNWEAATRLTMRLYLDFANFFIFLLKYLLISRRR